ncbi:MAG: PAS domain S-box protein [Phycisphaeraceae bacterium]|nr:PAS domain S-box protein [Phycisphaeraceae bacterium]
MSEQNQDDVMGDQPPPSSVSVPHTFGWGDSLGRVLNALEASVECLLQRQSWETGAQEALSHLGRAVEVSRAYLFEYISVQDSELVMRQRYEWAAPGIKPQINNPVLQNLSIRDDAAAILFAAHCRGQPYAGRVDQLTAAEREVLEPQDIKSLAVFPIMVRGACWGFIGFDDCTRPRTWSESEMTILKIAADIFAGAINRQLEEDIRRSAEERYRWLAEQSNDVITRCTPEGRYLFISDSVRRHFGQKPDELIGRHIWEFIHPEDVGRVRRLKEEAMAGANSGLAEFRRLCADGRHVWAEIAGTPIRDPKTGQVVELMMRKRNIEARKLAEAALRESEARFRAIFESSGEGIFIYSPDEDLIVQANPAMARMLGLPVDQIMGKPPAQFGLSEDEPVERRMSGLLATLGEEVVIRDRRYVARDGTTIWARVNATRLDRDDDRSRHILFLVSDLTERIVAEQRLSESEAGYRRVAESNRRLLNEVNHRTKNNLASILGLVSMTAHQASDARQFASDLENRILALSRVHEMLSRSQWRDLDFQSIVCNVAEALARTLPFDPQLRSRGPEITIAPRIASPLALVLQELFTNGVKHGAFRDHQGTVDLEWAVKDGHLTLIWREHLAEGARPLTSTLAEGTGIRLIRGLVEHEIGGKVAFKLDPGGMTITINLPNPASPAQAIGL